MAATAAPTLAQSGEIVPYTSQPNTGAQQTIDAFQAKHPGIDIWFVRDGTPKIIAKLQAEFAAGAACQLPNVADIGFPKDREFRPVDDDRCTVSLLIAALSGAGVVAAALANPRNSVRLDADAIIAPFCCSFRANAPGLVSGVYG